MTEDRLFPPERRERIWESIQERSEEPLTYSVAYEGVCPRCGDDLLDPDHHLARTCGNCGITVNAAEVTIRELTADE